MAIPDFIQERIQKSKGRALNLFGLGFFDDDIPTIVSWINDNPLITKLDLSGHNFGDVGAEALLQLKYVNDLSVSQTHIRNAGAITLISSPKFYALDISRNGIIDDEAGKVILANANQLTLNISGTDITKELAEQINARIANNHAQNKTHPFFTGKAQSTVSATTSTVSSASTASVVKTPNTGVFSRSTPNGKRSQTKKPGILKPPQSGLVK